MRFLKSNGGSKSASWKIPVAERPRKRARYLARGFDRLETRRLLATATFDNEAGDGDWNNPINWAGDSVPVDNDQVIIPDFTPDVSVTLGSGTPSLLSLTSHEALIISGGSLSLAGSTSTIHRDLTIAAGGRLSTVNSIVNGAGFLINSGTIEVQGGTIAARLNNHGTLLALAGNTTTIQGQLTTSSSSIIRVQSDGAGAGRNAVLQVISSLTNHGLIELTQEGGPAAVSATLNVFALTHLARLTNAPGATIRSAPGTGGSRQLNAQFNNQGTIRVDRDLGTNFAAADHVNTGLIDVAGGNFEVLQSSSTPTFRNDGVIRISTSRGMRIGGGVLTNLSGSTLTGGTYEVAGVLRVPNAAVTTLAATVILDGSNAVIMNDDTNGSGIDGLSTVTPAGRFELRNGRNLFAAGPFLNAGTVKIGSGGTLSLPLGGPSYTQAAGSTVVDAGARLSAGSSFNLNGGLLGGGGAIAGRVVNSGGILSPGASPGTFTIVGDYSQGPAGSLTIEIAGTTPGTEFDRLNVTGIATLNGTLNIARLNGYLPGGAHNLRFLSAASRNGAFSTINGASLPNGRTIEVAHDAVSASLRLTAEILVTPVSGLETSEPGGRASFQVVLTALPAANVTISVASSDAGEGTTDTGSLTFSPADFDVPRIVEITGSDDFRDDGDANYTILLNNVTSSDSRYRAIDPVDVSVTNLDDDLAVPTLSIADVVVVEGESGSRNATFTVTLSRTTSRTVTVSYATADDSANAGTDYTPTSGVLSFAAGAKTKTINVPILGDSVSEANESFFLNLSSPVNAILSDDQGFGTIVNDDPLPLLSVANVSAVEGNTGTKTINFTVDLSALSASIVTVNYRTADGSATAGSDYVSASGTLNFNPGQKSKTVAVVVNGDADVEADEFFRLELTNPTNANILNAQAFGLIQNNDAFLSVADASTLEGDVGLGSMAFVVTLSNPVPAPVTFQYASRNGSALSGADYTAENGLATIPAGQTTATIAIPISRDAIDEINETFNLTISSSINAVISDAQAVGTIVDDDPEPTLVIDDVSLTEGDAGVKNARFTVRLIGASSKTVIVNYATADDSATAGGDYVTRAGSLTFSPGQTSKTISVSINGDLLDESDETFFVNLSGASNATIADSRGLGTVVDDDSAFASRSTALDLTDKALSQVANASDTNDSPASKKQPTRRRIERSVAFPRRRLASRPGLRSSRGLDG